ncbi:hypothetical protein OS493_020975 [Desmophyllum pertusum]|uniref:Uncharacterized protein n=1 Tax=Desmophyllum pertusum TaxID=174260 RepID=A0A9X0A0X4_9CNID|nr:hypothetical protein OS493_020975 [Desmophyllum pertusum]
MKRKRAGITPIKFDLPPETKSPKKAKPSPTVVTVYTPPGRRAGASNGVVKGQTMPDGSRGRGFRQGGGRSRGRGRGWRGADFRSFILEHSETILINLRALYSGINCNYKQGQDYLWRRL